MNTDESYIKSFSKSVGEIALYNSKACLGFLDNYDFSKNDDSHKEVFKTLAYSVFDMLDTARKYNSQFDDYFLAETGHSMEEIEKRISDIFEKIQDE